MGSVAVGSGPRRLPQNPHAHSREPRRQRRKRDRASEVVLSRLLLSGVVFADRLLGDFLERRLMVVGLAEARTRTNRPTLGHASLTGIRRNRAVVAQVVPTFTYGHRS